MEQCDNETSGRINYNFRKMVGDNMRKRTCDMCGSELDKFSAKYCSKCREECLKSPAPFSARAKRKEPKIEYKIFSHADTRTCRKGCVYFDTYDKTCNYYLMTGKRRDCDATDCEKFIKRETKRNT